MKITFNALLMPLVLGLGLWACSSDKKGGGSAPAGGAESETPTEETAGETVEDVGPVTNSANAIEALSETPIAVKDYLEMYQSMLALTGLQGGDFNADSDLNINTNNDETFDQYYEGIKTSLPTTDSADAFIGSHAVTITKLAGEMCNTLYIMTEAGDSTFFEGITFPPNNAQANYASTYFGNGTNASDLAKSLMEKLFLIDPNTIANTDPTYVELVTLVSGTDSLTEIIPQQPQDNQSGFNPNDGGQVFQGVVVGACTAALASLHTILK